MPSKKTTKYKLLHLKLAGAKDKDVYKKAFENDRILVVFNTKDFLKLINDKMPTVISLSARLSTRQIDTKICKVLKELKKNEISGHHISISNSPTIIKRMLSADN